MVMADELRVPALKVPQWLDAWNSIPFDESEYRRKPDPFFFQFSMPASLLKRYTGVHKREAKSGERRGEELNTQRFHNPDRSREIKQFVNFGFPWSDLSDKQRADPNNAELRKPGWLPTAILINILSPGEIRGTRELAAEDAVTVNSDDGKLAEIVLPSSDEKWDPSEGSLHPFEVIDGQHRLWAFEDVEVPDTYELPVVAFVGLDRSWQAYLFWTINIKPKRINASLAYDLYPLLRSETWLEQFSGAFVYRETRAQELVEIMWGHPMSVWKDRINMLGAQGDKNVRQAAWIRSLVATFVRNIEGPRVKIGGLFGPVAGEEEASIPWSRPQQAAFLIKAWKELSDAIDETEPTWAKVLAEHDASETDESPMMFAPDSLLNTDQGVRGYLAVLNDLTVLKLSELDLATWTMDGSDETKDLSDVTEALDDLDRQTQIAEFLKSLGADAASFDWRTAGAPGLTPEAEMLRHGFRGSSGYGQVKRAVLKHLRDHGSPSVAETAETAIEKLFPDDV